MGRNTFVKWRSQSLSNKVFDVVNYSFLFLIFIICLYPLYYIVIISFSSEIVGTVWKPQDFSLDAYKMIFMEREIWIGYKNTIINSVLELICGLAVTLPCAYALSRKDLIGRNVFLAIIMFTMYVSGGLIPGYLNIYNLGLINNRWAVILSHLCVTYHLLIARTFFASSIPKELFDASVMDGCGNGRYFFRIVLPLSKPVIAVIGLYSVVGRWNSYFNEMIYFRDKELSPLTLVLRRLLWSIREMQSLIDQGMIDDAEGMMTNVNLASIMQYGLIVVSTLPMMIAYPFIQKYFAKGVMIGSVKG